MGVMNNNGDSVGDRCVYACPPPRRIAPRLYPMTCISRSCVPLPNGVSSTLQCTFWAILTPACIQPLCVHGDRELLQGVVAIGIHGIRWCDLPLVPRRKKTSPAAGDSRPDNPRFQTWNEAFNRAITDDLRFFIEYVNRDGEISGRVITPKSIHLMTKRPKVVVHQGAMPSPQ